MNNASLLPLGSTCSCWCGAEVDAFLLSGLLSSLLVAWLFLDFIFFALFRPLVRGIFCVNECLCLFLDLSFELRDNFVPIYCASLVSPGEFPAHIYEMRLLLLVLIILAVWRIEHELFIFKFQVRAVEVHSSTLWLSIGDSDINTVSLEDPLYFSCHFGNI